MGLYPERSNQPEGFIASGRWTGAATAALTKVNGAGLTITRLGVGNHRLAWDTPGAQLASLPMWVLASNTPTATAGFTVSFDLDSYSAANRTIDFFIYAADNSTATDLASTSGLGLLVPLTTSRVVG